jgi:hypothetical protein
MLHVLHVYLVAPAWLVCSNCHLEDHRSNQFLFLPNGHTFIADVCVSHFCLYDGCRGHEQACFEAHLPDMFGSVRQLEVIDGHITAVGDGHGELLQLDEAVSMVKISFVSVICRNTLTKSTPRTSCHSGPQALATNYCNEPGRQCSLHLEEAAQECSKQLWLGCGA